MGSDDNEKDSATLDDSTSRTIKLTGSGDRELFSMTRPATQGTPQKCLYHLASTCRDLLMEKREKGGVFNVDKGALIYNKKTNVNGILDAISKLPRDWWKKNNANLEVVNQLVTSAMKVYSGDTEKIAQMYSNILFKSLSDISQYGALLTNMADIETREKTVGGGYGDSYNVINSLYTPTYIGVSSDKIGAALMTMVASVFDYNFEILSTYKYAGITVPVVLLKSDVAGLALFMRKKGSIVDRLLEDGQLKLQNNEKIHIMGVRQQCLEVIEDYRTQNSIKKMDDHIVDLFRLKSRLKKIVRPEDVQKNRDLEKMVAYAGLIKRLSEIIYGENMAIVRLLYKALKEYVNAKGEDMYIECETYLYYISKSVHNLMFPLNKQVSKEKKAEISRQEIIGACYDNIYGHDFYGLDFIAQLGKKFVGQVFAKSNNYLFSPDAIKTIENSANREDKCIQEALNKSDYVSVGFLDKKVAFFIGNKSNLLTFDFPQLSSRTDALCSQTYLFKTPFDNKTYFYSIDFYSGTQPNVHAKSAIMNILNGYLCKEDILENDRETYMKLYKKQLDKMKQTGQLEYEVFTPATYYDGAANYGLYDIIINEPYNTKYAFGSYVIDVTTRVVSDKKGKMAEFIETKYNEANLMKGYYDQYTESDQAKIYGDARLMKLMNNIDLRGNKFVETYLSVYELFKAYASENTEIMSLLGFAPTYVNMVNDNKPVGTYNEKKMRDFFANLIFMSINLLVKDEVSAEQKEKVYVMLDYVLKKKAVIRTPESGSEYSMATSRGSRKSASSKASSRGSNKTKKRARSGSQGSQGSRGSKGSKGSRGSRGSQGSKGARISKKSRHSG
jgi:hypothetical protein